MEKRNPIPERRRFAGYDRNGGAIEEIEATGEVNCARCARIGGFDAEGQRGFCCWLRIMVSTWHPARCKAFASA
jgi:hypothetical protein